MLSKKACNSYDQECYGFLLWCMLIIMQCTEASAMLIMYLHEQYVPVQSFCLGTGGFTGASLSEPHTREKTGKNLYVYMYASFVCTFWYLFQSCWSHFQLLFCEFFASFINSKGIHKLLSKKRQTVCLLDGNSTYSMARAILATIWQKCFICRCRYLHCH